MCALVFGVKGHDIHHLGGFRKHTCVHTHEDVAPGEGWTKLFVLFFKAVCYLDIILGEDWREVARFRIGLQKERFRVEASHGQHLYWRILVLSFQRKLQMAMCPCSNNRQSMLGRPRPIPTGLHHSRDHSWGAEREALGSHDHQQQFDTRVPSGLGLGAYGVWLLGSYQQCPTAAELFNIPRPLQL